MHSGQTRKIIFQALKDKGPVSGQVLARAAGVSRNAIWKHICRLQQEGYAIESILGKGYILHPSPDLLLPLEIKSGLKTKILGQEIVCRPELDSTQELAKTLARQNASEGLLVLTERQLAGRGRMHRNWCSPAGNIYMSCLLRPEMELHRAPHITLMAGVAVNRALQRYLQLESGLKWPNDILYQDKKLGGILAEISAEADRIGYIVLGLGLNVNAQSHDFSPELSNLAHSLNMILQRHVPRVQVLQEILLEMENVYLDYLNQGFAPVRSSWLEMNCTLGREVEFLYNRHQTRGVAQDMDEYGRLVVRTVEGQVLTLHTGDIQLV